MGLWNSHCNGFCIICIPLRWLYIRLQVNLWKISYAFLFVDSKVFACPFINCEQFSEDLGVSKGVHFSWFLYIFLKNVSLFDWVTNNYLLAISFIVEYYRHTCLKGVGRRIKLWKGGLTSEKQVPIKLTKIKHIWRFCDTYLYFFPVWHLY